MRSPMIVKADWLSDAEKKNYGEMKPMQSAAGWYLGTEHTDPLTGEVTPGSRDSHLYYETREAVVALMEDMEAMRLSLEDASHILRRHP